MNTYSRNMHMDMQLLISIDHRCLCQSALSASSGSPAWGVGVVKALGNHLAHLLGLWSLPLSTRVCSIVFVQSIQKTRHSSNGVSIYIYIYVDINSYHNNIII